MTVEYKNSSSRDGNGDSVDMNVGGQAVIEGVMMRSQRTIATAVRLPDGTIELKKRPFVSFVKRHRYLDIPIVRGAINFFEMLIIGIDTLNWSADIQMQYEDRKNGKEDSKRKSFWNSLMIAGSVLFAFALALGIFFAFPIYVTTLLGLQKGALLFNLVAGIIRLMLFLLYIYIISKLPDIKRIFRYHGAEHMSIYALESSVLLNIESTRGKSRFHPRCGTSFILIVALFSIVLFGIADSLFPLAFGHIQSFPERLATHLMLLPLVAGLSYELLKLTGKFRSNRLVKLLIAPGLWLQTITTAEPDDDMLEVALCALKAALDREEVEA
ncbi:DUF1385 domain-containing protein [Candidatus Latescibacterota bacterium]